MFFGDSLIQSLPHVELHHWHPFEVGQIVCDSRRVAPGDLFVAVPGVIVDGHRYVPDAVRAGAVACVVERMLPELEGLPVALVPDAREALAYLHAALNGYPARQLKVIGITGTDGKTTTTRLTTAMLRQAGYATGAVDSVGATIGDQEQPTGFHTTTPDAPEVQGYLAEMVRAGMEYAVIESTSHGLAQHRVSACEFDIAVVTNITHEHLDYHGTYEAYREAKARLFRHLATAARKNGMPKVSVLNADDEGSYAYLRSIPADVQMTYGLRNWATIMARDISASPTGLHFVVVTPEGDFALDSPLAGRYNVYNILAAVCVALSQGIAPEAIQTAVASVFGVSGRGERIDLGQPYSVIVDFAHTPNALENVLQMAREATSGQVTVVFGCAGLRDRAKRPLMGEVAGRLADRVVITAEDPRTEPLDEIMAQVMAGCEQAGCAEGEGFWRVADRGEAIAMALRMAAPGDVVVVAGKGHERSMCFGNVEHPWSDQEVVMAALRDLGYG